MTVANRQHPRRLFVEVGGGLGLMQSLMPRLEKWHPATTSFVMRIGLIREWHPLP